MVVLFPERAGNVIVNVASCRRAVRFDRATMRLNQPPRKRRAEAEPPAVARSMNRPGGKGQRRWQEIRSDASAGFAHGAPDFRAAARQSRLYAPTRLSELDRVGEVIPISSTSANSLNSPSRRMISSSSR
jgi:hypothetical protein